MSSISTQYLYAYFHGDETRDDDQQVYFAVGDDALHWDVLNGERPVLVSTVGDRGARDPFLLRMDDGEVVLLATDLTTKHPRYASVDGAPDWDRMQRDGSHMMLVWRSRDLTHWEGPSRADMVGDLPLGNVWAPKATFVPERRSYLVYWSSACAADGYAKERIYARWTADFREFSDPFLLVERDHSCIDADLVRWERGASGSSDASDECGASDGSDGSDMSGMSDGGRAVWVLYLKNENDKTVGAYVSPRLFDGECDGADDAALSRGFTRVRQHAFDGLRGLEGPAGVRRADGSTVLYLDEYMGEKRGYLPFVSDDPTRADSFARVPADDCRMPRGARHGSVLPITGCEAAALLARFGA